MQGDRTSAMHDHTYTQKKSFWPQIVHHPIFLFVQIRLIWCRKICFLGTSSNLWFLSKDGHTGTVRGVRKERKARSQSIVTLTGKGHNRCSDSLDDWRGGRKTEMTKAKQGPLVQADLECAALLKIISWREVSEKQLHGGQWRGGKVPLQLSSGSVEFCLWMRNISSCLSSPLSIGGDAEMLLYSWDIFSHLIATTAENISLSHTSPALQKSSMSPRYVSCRWQVNVTESLCCS